MKWRGLPKIKEGVMWNEEAVTQNNRRSAATWGKV